MGPKKKGDARGGPKPGTKQAKSAAEQAAESSKTPPPANEQKKPSVKEVIGGASWTGKLPVNMLSEHCQKQKWEKPEYTMVCVKSVDKISQRCHHVLIKISFRYSLKQEKDLCHQSS